VNSTALPALPALPGLPDPPDNTASGLPGDGSSDDAHASRVHLDHEQDARRARLDAFRAHAERVFPAEERERHAKAFADYDGQEVSGKSPAPPRPPRYPVPRDARLRGPDPQGFPETKK
jgi:hypothetical protein